ncbi:MAG: lipopolysaccharide heptosyltransferase family protein [Calditrichaeota bacterium]|nr:MAG: lipopolysaccharide heptosyltransferase family protein [Calditrichota bacterium]
MTSHLFPSPKRFIISRTDGIGDVLLTLPLAGALKQHDPDCTIAMLGRSYTEPLVRACEHVDVVLNWDEVKNRPLKEQAEWLADYDVDTIIHVFPRKEIAAAARRARIPRRIGTSHRTYHWWTCNRLAHFSRKTSDLHESQLNLRLLEPLGFETQYPLDQIPSLYGLTTLAPLSPEFSRLIDPQRFNLILHPKSKGSAKEWGVENFARLISALPRDRFKLFITGSAAEGMVVGPTLLQPFPHVFDLTGKMELDQLIAFIAAADGLLACSTGPLHLAAALSKAAVGLYSSRRPLHPGRWAPLGVNVRVIEDGIAEPYQGRLQIPVERVINTIVSNLGI